MTEQTTGDANATAHVLAEIRFDPDPEHLLRQVRLASSPECRAEVVHLLEEARAVARPKAFYRLAYLQLVDDERVRVDGVELRSRVLRVNLGAAYRVFAYLATCGCELDEWAHTKTDPLEQYWADALKELALGTAIRALHEDIVQRYRPGPTSVMAPGSLADWPIQQQRPLFALLGDGPGRLGVRLSASYLMVPNKSVTGIRFPRQQSFESCMLCPRPDCPNRRASYDRTLYRRQYAGRTTSAVEEAHGEPEHLLG